MQIVFKLYAVSFLEHTVNTWGVHNQNDYIWGVNGVEPHVKYVIKGGLYMGICFEYNYTFILSVSKWHRLNYVFPLFVIYKDTCTDYV